MKFLILFLLCLSCAYAPKAPPRESKVFTVKWAKNLDPYYLSGNLPVGLGAPRIFREIVYMGSLSGHMRAYDLDSGRELWQKQEGIELGAPAEFFDEHVTYGGVNGRLFVRHYLTGELKYAIDLGASIESAPYYFNGRLLIYLRGHQLVQLDAETGKVIWAYKRAVPMTTTLQRTTRPLVIGRKIIVGFADGHVGALSVDEGLILWETKIAENAKFVDVDLNPLLARGQVITGPPSGELKAINPESGALSRSFGVSVMAHPELKGDRLLLGTNEGEVILMDLNGVIQKRVKVSSLPVSAVKWWKDYIVAASFDGVLRAIDPLDFKVTDEFALGHAYSAVFSDLVVHENYLALYSSRNRLYVFK